MVTISLCMIVKNEEAVLERCLSSVADLVDEIVLVDTGSNDRTREIAKKFTNLVLDFSWVDDFSAARNYAFAHASSTYCIWLDADDVMLDADRAQFMALKETLEPTVAVVMMPYHTGFDEQGNVTFSYYRERVIKNHAGMHWVGAVHEVIQPIGKVIHNSSAITHKKMQPSDPERNLRIFTTQLEQGVVLEPRQQFYYGRELYYHKQYEQAIAIFEQFLKEPTGWLENKIDACCHCAYCYYALEQEEKAIQALLHSLVLDLPRAEVCCQLGMHFFDRGQWRQSAFWYTLAPTCLRDDRRGGFTAPDCYGYLPCIQLCVCYSQLGELEKAERFNALAAAYKPESEAVRHNRRYFEGLKTKEMNPI